MDGEINMNAAIVWTIKILEQEIDHFERVFKSMDLDGGRYNTTVSVLKERLEQVKKVNKYERKSNLSLCR